MPYLYLIVSLFCSASASIFGTYFNRRTADKKDASALYSFLKLSAVFFGWLIIWIFDFSFSAAVLPYSIGFGVCFAVCNIFLVKALACGPTSLTSLFSSLSMIVVSVWGCLFWKEDFTWNVGIGLALACVSFFLCLYSGKSEKKLSLKWLLYAVLVMFSNAGCSIAQRMQQMKCDYQYGNAMMVFASLFSVLCAAFLYIRKDKQGDKEIIVKSAAFPVSAGLCNVILNLFVILLAATTLPASLIYPVIGVGSLAVTMIFSVFAFREKLKWWQWVGILCGVVTTLLLSL